MPLCTQLDVEQKLQWDITAEPDTTVAALIADAQALIESEIGRTIESAARTETFDGGHFTTLQLKHWPVTDVTSVKEDTKTLAAEDYTFYEDGRLVRVSNGRPRWWASLELQGIEVVYVGGLKAGTHDMELEHLGSLCAEVVARAFRQGAASAAVPPGAGPGGVESVSLDGSDAVKFSTTDGGSFELGGGLTRFVFLLENEKSQLDRYNPPLIA